MFPIRDSVRPERTPYVNWVLLLANLVVYAHLALVVPPDAQQEFVERFGLVPARVRLAFSHPQLFLDTPWPALRDAVLPFFTSMFLHGGTAHLLGNLWFLHVFGDNIEGRLGHKRYLAFYLLCGVVASALHVASIPPTGVVGENWRGALVVGPNPALDAPMVGASGAIAGVLGAYVVIFSRARVLTWFPPIFFFEVSALLFLGVWFVGQFLAARSSRSLVGIGVGVAYWAHVGGFAAGVLLGLLAPKSPRAPPGGR